MIKLKNDDEWIQIIKAKLDRVRAAQKRLFEEEAALLAQLRILGHKVMKEAMLK